MTFKVYSPKDSIKVDLHYLRGSSSFLSILNTEERSIEELQLEKEESNNKILKWRDDRGFIKITYEKNFKFNEFKEI